MQMLQNANETKCMYNKIQIRQNANVTKYKWDTIQM